MYSLKIVSAILGILLFTNVVSAAENDLVIPDKFKNSDGSLNIELIKSAHAKQQHKKLLIKAPNRSNNAQALPSRYEPSDGQRPVIQSNDSVKTSFKFLLRKDFSDIYLFSSIIPSDKAEGAEISWTRDQVSHDTIWATDGMAALIYTYFIDDYYSSSPLIGFSVAPYLKVDKQFHSKANDSDVDVVTTGGTAEFLVKSLLGFRSPDVFRGRLSGTEDHFANTRTMQATGEWIPVYLSLPGSIGGILNYNIMPELITQYQTRSTGQTPLAFSGQDNALRVGPSAILLWGFHAPQWPDWLQTLLSFRGKLTYHWWTEAYSGRQSSWLETSIFHNLDPEGNFSISASYKLGRSEETGVNTNIFKISLTAKPCVELTAMGWCKSASLF